LHDQSRAPKAHPHALTPEIVDAILALRHAHPTWGPVKLRHFLHRQHPDRAWPAASTIGELLHRKGLCHPAHRRGMPQATPSTTLTTPTTPNHVWNIDFKGWFATGDGTKCHPLTLTDGHTRFLLRCQALATPDGAHVRPILEAAFREYGLPTYLRSDNGSPFASTGLGGLSRLSLWWLKLGIRPERITPGRPQQNGRHERFHRTLKEDLALDVAPAPTLRAQETAFLAYRHTYNTLRPHAALGGLSPAHVYTPSPRPYPARLPAFAYPADAIVRLIHTNGCLKWQGRLIFVSEVLIGEHIEVRPLTERHWAVFVGPLALAVYDDARSQWLPRAEAQRLFTLCGEEDIL
jgi:transposase InsO family protein